MKLCAPGKGDELAEGHVTLYTAIRRNAELRPNWPALLSSNFHPLSYGDLQLQFDKIRSRLREAGFDHRSRIGVLLPNGPQAVVTIVAVACCATAVPLDPRLTDDEVHRRLQVLPLDAIVLLKGSISDGRRAAERSNLRIIEATSTASGKLELELATPFSNGAACQDDPDPHSTAFILQSSGTTADPKLIPFSHRNMLAAANRLQGWFGLTHEDRCLSVASPFYSHGLKVTVFTPLLTGGSILLPENSSVVDLTEWLALLPTWCSAGPTLYGAVIDRARMMNRPLTHNLRFIVSGGAPLATEVYEGLQDALNVPVLEHYGLSEAAQIAANLPPPGPSKPGTCGIPWPGTVAIIDADGEPVAAGEQGEVLVQGPTVMSGYLGDPALNEAAFVDGFFRTGDLGSLDQDGFLTLHGRLNERINRGGDKVAPVEIDCALLLHPAVAEAAAFAIPSARFGEDVGAAVVLRPGSSASPAELRQFLKTKLASFKMPRRIRIVDQLPKGLTGKVQRWRLSNALSEAIEQPARVDSDIAETPSELEAELLKLWRKLLKSEAITVDDDFFESGGDSLLAIDMLVELEGLVGHQISEAVLAEASTIRDLVLRLNEQSRSQEHMFASFNLDGTRPPLFFFRGDLDSGFYLRRWATILGTDQPIVGIPPHGLHGGPIPTSITEMAFDRLHFILERQPTGPFLLAGYCKGAFVALEIARFLVEAGHEVKLVAMVDPPTVNAHATTRAILKLLKRVSPGILDHVYYHLTRIERLSKAPGEKLASTVQRLLGKAEAKPMPALQGAYTSAMARYLPSPLHVPVVVYAAEHHGKAWKRISPDLELVEVPGGHTGCLTTQANLLPVHLRQRLIVHKP